MGKFQMSVTTVGNIVYRLWDFYEQKKGQKPYLHFLAREADWLQYYTLTDTQWNPYCPFYLATAALIDQRSHVTALFYIL